MFGTLVSDMQTALTVGANAITGTLKYLTSGDLVDTWGAGYFMALKFTGIPASATSVLVGLDPSEGSGLVEIINDLDKNGAFKVSNKSTQKFKVVATDGTNTVTKTYDLSGLTLADHNYTQAELEDMTISQIEAIALERGYTITATLKADIIQEFLAQQNA